MTTKTRRQRHGSAAVRERLNYLHDTLDLSWRKISKRSEYSGIPQSTLNAIAKGGDIPEKWLKKLGLSPKPEPPAWVTQAADWLAEREQPETLKRVYDRLGREVK